MSTSKQRNILKAYSYCSIILFLAFLVASWKFRFAISKELYSWIFSSIIQGFLALVAVFGSLGIFRIANLQSQVKISTSNAVKALESFKGLDLKRQLKGPQEIVKEVKKDADYYNQDLDRLMPDVNARQGLKLAEEEANKVTILESALRDEALLLTNSISPILVLVAVTLIIFPFSYSFSKYFIGVTILAGIIIGSVYSLINLYISFKKYLKNESLS